MPNTGKNVTVAKPKAAGAVFVAPADTALPTDAKTALAEAFKCLGYISEDGVTQTTETESQDIKAWGGDTVASVMTSYTEQVKMMFIEQNVDVLKQVYGESNVEGTWSTGLTVKHNAQDKKEYVYVIETTMLNDRVDRLVIPRGKVIEVGDVVRKNDEVMGYDTTIKCLADDSENTAYEYMAEVAKG